MIKILEGENTFLSRKKLDLLISEYLKDNPDANYKNIDASHTKISEILNEYETQDMFCKKKLLVIKRLLSNKDWKDFVEKIFETKDLSKNTDLIIWEEKNVAKNTRYYKNFNQIKAIESFPKFNKRSFENWAKELINLKNLCIEKDAIITLMEMTNYDPFIFENEIEKLKLTEKTTITISDLEENTNDAYTNSIWEFLDSVNEGCKEQKHIKILENLLKNGLDPHYLMVMIARNTKQLLLINELLDKNKNDKEIISILKIPPFTFPKLKTLAKKSEYEKLLQIYEKIYNLNYETKVGNIPADLGLILLATKLS